MYFNGSRSWRPKPLAVVTRTVLTVLMTGGETDDGAGKNNLRKNDQLPIRLSHTPGTEWLVS